ncbi:MAG: MMPL family transporter [Chloroflexi bacterium]|nr:MMPL family transporter [Chloroflexota bacterium]
MFRWLGDFAARHRIAIIIGWIIAAALLIATAPPLDEVSSTDQRDFLPADAPFAQAQEVFERTFPAEFSASSTVILIDAGEGGDIHNPAIWDYIAQVEAYLNSDDAPENIGEVAAPTTDPLLADVLISPDQRIALISASLTTPTDAAITTHAVHAIDDWLEQNPPQGFVAYQTGEAGLNAQAEESTFTTMDRTLLLTFALVVVALLLIYRSPVSPIIPLLSVTIAFIASVGIISHLARLDVMNVIAQVNALLVVVMYGAGTDYNLFLISRFREELADSIGVQNATRRTVRLVGETITSSAGTVFVGFMAMVFAEIGMIKSAGPMLAIGIAVSLLAGLTLTPALLATLGERAFWPGKASHRAAGRFYEVTSKLVSSRPLLTIVVIVGLMIPFSVYGLARDLNYDFVSELPKTIDSVKAYDLLRDQMGGGSLFPLNVIVTGREAASVPAEIKQLSAELAAVAGVTDLRSLDMPLGLHHERIANLLRVDGQLNTLANLAGEQGGSTGLQGAADVVGSIQRYMALLVERFPEIAADPNYTTARAIVDGGLLQLALRQGELMDAVRGLAERFAQMDSAELMPPMGDGDLFAELRPLADSYLAEGGTAYRIDVILNDPLSDQGQAAVMAVRDLLRRYDTPEGEAVVSGFPAVMTDLHNVMKGDIIRTGSFIMGGIFLVLLLMLRSAVAPLYLIATVLLSFTCTLGITGLFFQVIFGVEKLSWLLPIFMLGFLIGLGIDYSIFLFGRIKEEVAHYGVREGVHMAVAKTGAIITSAAVILAGTFAGMITGEIAFLAQMGFAVSVGVLLDAFVVRTMLDPALATLFGKWTWWPGGVPQPENDPTRALTPAAEIRA